MRKAIIRFLTIGIFPIILFSCQKENIVNDHRIKNNDIINLEKQKAINKFAQVLSRAIYKEPKLREFIKNLTLEQFDNFLDPVFDRKLNTKFSQPPAEYIIQDAPQVLIDAYNEFGTDPIYWQRDYIYWGLTKTNPKNGYFNPQVREYIHKIRINPNLLTTISDQPSDPKLTSFGVKSDNKNPVSWTDIVKRVWTDGNFELRFYIYKGKRNGNSSPPDIRMLNVSPRNLFKIKRIKHAVKGGGVFHRDKQTYSVESIHDLEGKWITPNLQLEKWDIYDESMTMTISMEEYDPSENLERTVTNKYASNTNFKLDVGFGTIIKKIIKLDLSLDYSNHKEETWVENTKWVTTYASDVLGNVTYYFSDPVLRGPFNKYLHSQNLFYYPYSGWIGYEVGTGGIDIMLLPKPLY